MDTLTITRTGKNPNTGIFIPSSKSYIHRYLISALFADGESVIENVSFSNDIRATLSCIEELGAKVTVSDDTSAITVRGARGKKACVNLDCGESASTLRFMIPVAMHFADNIHLTGAHSLFTRPLDPYFEIFQKSGISYEFCKGKYLRIYKGLDGGEFFVDGSVSSQFVTGLLFALPLKESDSVVNIGGILQSKPYVDITLEVLKNSGIEIENDGYSRFCIKGNQRYTPSRFFAQGDYSQVAFFLVAGCFAGGIECTNMEPDSLQGDRAVVDILTRMGADIKTCDKGFCVGKSRLKSIGTIDASDIPDIIPILSLACAVAEGTTVIENIQRLKIKECDRAYATVDVLSKLGADIREENSRLIINGKKFLNGGRVSSFNDHRMAMTAAVASLVCEESVTIEEPMSIRKSYPGFYDDLLSTGAVKYE